MGFVLKVVVIDRLGSPKVVNSNHKRPEVLERADRPQINQRQRDANNGEQREGNLEIGVRHHRVTVLFEIEPFGIVESWHRFSCEEVLRRFGPKTRLQCR